MNACGVRDPDCAPEGCVNGEVGGGREADLRRQRPKAIYVRVYNGFAASMQN